MALGLLINKCFLRSSENGGCLLLIGLSSKQKTLNTWNILCKSRSSHKEEELKALETLCIIKVVYLNFSEYDSKEG